MIAHANQIVRLLPHKMCACAAVAVSAGGMGTGIIHDVSPPSPAGSASRLLIKEGVITDPYAAGFMKFEQHIQRIAIDTVSSYLRFRHLPHLLFPVGGNIISWAKTIRKVREGGKKVPKQAKIQKIRSFERTDEKSGVFCVSHRSMNFSSISRSLIPSLL